MTRYTDTDGNTTVLCDHCRADLSPGSTALMLSPGKVENGYAARDYDRGELILCPACAGVVNQIMRIMGIKRADMSTLQEAA